MAGVASLIGSGAGKDGCRCLPQGEEPLMKALDHTAPKDDSRDNTEACSPVTYGDHLMSHRKRKRS
jgi:hypothetical protein